MCRQSHRPRGDAVVHFQSKEGAQTAVEELHCKHYLLLLVCTFTHAALLIFDN